MLGTEEDFRALCEDAHAHGMKVILDGVFSHVGSRSGYFQRPSAIRTRRTAAGSGSSTIRTSTTAGGASPRCPCVDKMNPDYLRYVIDDDDSVAVRWLKLGADGWRLDVVDELPDAFLARLRARIRAV